MLNEKELKVLNVVETVGPVLPTEISKTVGMDSFLVSAILATLVKNNSVKHSNRRIGSSLIYYVSASQEERMRGRLLGELNELEKKALERIKALRVAFDEDLYPQERLMLKELKDFAMPIQVRLDDGREIHCWKYHEVSDEELKQIVDNKFRIKKGEKPEELVVSKPIEELTEAPVLKPQRIRKTVVKGKLSKDVSEYLEKIKAKSIELSENRSEITGTAMLDSQVGQQEFLVKAFGKKNIGEAELSKIYLECNQLKKPVLLLVKSELSKKSSDYAKKYLGSLIKIIKI